MDINKRIEDQRAATMKKISKAAESGNLALVTSETRRAATLETLSKAVLEIEKKLDELESDSVPVGKEMQRILKTAVTQGMINQNLLTLTPHVKRGRIKAGETMVIETVPSRDTFKTDLMENGNKVRERGAIGRFYREASVRAGDFVELVEQSPGRWILQKSLV